MTINEFQTKLKKIKDKRKSLFKKINKCDKDIVKLTQTFILSDLDFTKGDRFIAINKYSNDREYVQVGDIIVNYDANTTIDSARLVVIFKRMSANWRVPRDFCWVKTWEVALTKEHTLPTQYWVWNKIED